MLRSLQLWSTAPSAVQVGVSESRLRHWLLSITARLQAQNGGILPALALWRKNCAKEFAGELSNELMALLEVCVCVWLAGWLAGWLAD